MEIIVLPYMAISFAIAWAIFSPFAEIEDLSEWTFANLETIDLFGVLLSISLLLAVAGWTTPLKGVSTWVSSLIATAILLYSLTGLIVGLYLFAKLERPSSLKRMTMIGLVIPFGALLTIGWIVVPLFAFSKSILYAIPATMSVVPVTLILRGLSGWVCQNNTREEQEI